MLAQRAARQSLRGSFVTKSISTHLLALSVGSANRSVHNGPQSRSPTSPTENDILAKQRLRRPLAPHLTIYRPQTTSVLSVMNRITGIILSGGLYLYGGAYLAASSLGYDIGSSTIAASFAAWPFALAFVTKFLVGWTFTFHSLNGVRHIVWDAGRMMTNKAVHRSGLVVAGVSGIAALGLALL